MKNVTIFKDAREAIAANYRPCKRCKPDELMTPSEAWVAEITDLIERRLNEPFTLEALAEQVHGSPYHLQRTFKHYVGITPAQYAQEKRIERATRLLAGTSLSVAAVAAEVGMPSPAHFATVFLAKTGVTPTQYRRQLILSQGGSAHERFETNA